MVRYRVRGGNALRGTAFIQGAKNAVLPMIGAALLAAKGRTVLRNVPIIEDVRRAVELAEAIGAYVELHESERTLVIDASKVSSPVLPAEIARRFRGSVLFTPPPCCTASARPWSRAWAAATSAAATSTSTTSATSAWARSSTRARPSSTSRRPG
ncbi:hypothetical protein GCM10020001_048850 [Nonomuraea salmonea]